MAAGLHTCFENLPDYRTGTNTRYEIRDGALSAFSIFFMQSPSFLAHQRIMHTRKGKNNVQSLFGVEHIPSDNQIRNLLDTLEPELIYGLFPKAISLIEEHGMLESFQSYDGQILISNDGTQTISSKKINCSNCSERSLANEKTLYSHSAILPVIVKAGESRVLVLEPEFITPQDGHEKQDCERVAMKRWVERNAERFAKNSYTMLGDDLYANQPLCETFLGAGFNFILVCKPDSHVALYEQVEFLAKNGSVEQVEQRSWNGRYHEKYLYRFVNDVPLRREDPLQVNWCELTITREDTGKELYHNSFITNHKINAANVIPIVRDGRARWKSENETNNILKTKGYHLEHNFGHGEQFLANFLTTLNLLAFLLHTLLDLLDEHYRTLRRYLVTRKDFFNDLRALLRYMIFDGWIDLMFFMLRSLELIPNT